jgi:hypothetical protein
VRPAGMLSPPVVNDPAIAQMIFMHKIDIRQ